MCVCPCFSKEVKWTFHFLFFFFVCLQDGSGSIDFREYLIGLSLVSQPANTENTLRFAFEVTLP